MKRLRIEPKKLGFLCIGGLAEAGACADADTDATVLLLDDAVCAGEDEAAGGVGVTDSDDALTGELTGDAVDEF